MEVVTFANFHILISITVDVDGEINKWKMKMMKLTSGRWRW